MRIKVAIFTKMKSQLLKISEVLIEKGKITTPQAISMYIIRLGALIHILRNDGWKIDGKYLGKNKQKTRTYEYTLVARPKCK